MAAEKKMGQTTELVPPDGGYGWVIVLVSGLFYVSSEINANLKLSLKLII